jgi:hypothetical protein
MADELYFPVSFDVEEACEKYGDDEQAFQHLHRVVVDDMGYGENNEAEDAEEEDVADKDDAGSPERIGLGVEDVANKKLPQEVHPVAVEGNVNPKGTVFYARKNIGKVKLGAISCANCKLIRPYVMATIAGRCELVGVSERKRSEIFRIRVFREGVSRIFEGARGLRLAALPQVD